jgi:kumamolisin
MKRSFQLCATAAAVVLVFTWTISAIAQDDVVVNQTVNGSDAAAVPHVKAKQGVLVVPRSSIAQTPPAGHKFVAHTNVRFLIPGGFTPDELPPFTGYAYETPASLACVYGLVTTASGCNPNTVTTNPTGGSQSIAIVDAYDDPEADGDIAWFSLQFGIPLKSSAQFQVIWADTPASSCYTSGVPTDPTGGWELEESLDIEWSHAMAPGATIYLVEACSNYDSDLQQAVLVAANLVKCGKTEITGSGVGTCPAGSTGKGEVSMSWGGEEYSTENASNSCAFLDDSCFTAANVVYVASSGDSPGTIYPATSPNVVSAGGLTTRRNPSTGNLIGSAGWVDAGGGLSFYEARPSYQSSISSIVGIARGVPDLAFDADPNTGVWVYDTFPMDYFEYYSWWIVGGTSVAAPSLAGIINRAGAFAASTNAELTKMYTNKAVTTHFTDITTAFCGPYMGYSAAVGYDFCSGIGAPKGYGGK